MRKYLPLSTGSHWQRSMRTDCGENSYFLAGFCPASQDHRYMWEQVGVSQSFRIPSLLPEPTGQKNSTSFLENSQLVLRIQWTQHRLTEETYHTDFMRQGIPQRNEDPKKQWLSLLVPWIVRVVTCANVLRPRVLGQGSNWVEKQLGRQRTADRAVCAQLPLPQLACPWWWGCCSFLVFHMEILSSVFKKQHKSQSDFFFLLLLFFKYL
jgi:hypothetical protein